MNLQPYTNISSGTPVVVGLIVQGTVFPNPVPKELIVTNEGIFEGIGEGTVRLRLRNGQRVNYAGRMIKSITPKRTEKRGAEAVSP